MGRSVDAREVCAWLFSNLFSDRYWVLGERLESVLSNALLRGVEVVVVVVPVRARTGPAGRSGPLTSRSVFIYTPVPVLAKGDVVPGTKEVASLLKLHFQNIMFALLQ